MLKFLSLQGKGGGPYAFSNKAGQQDRHLVRYFKAEWERLGLPTPAPTFALMRSAVTTHVSYSFIYIHIKVMSEVKVYTIVNSLCNRRYNEY